MSLATRVWCVTVLLASLALIAGCGRPVGTVSGKVTYQGKTLKGGSVTFVSTEGRQSFAAGIGEDGTYSVPNIRGGEYKVCVETDSQKPPPDVMIGPGMKMPPVAKGKFGPPPDAPVPEGYTPSDPASAAAALAAKRYVKIPDQYKDPNTTTLTYTFPGGNQTFDIDLK